MKFSNEAANALTTTAHSIAMRILRETGNQPHEHQQKALKAILDSMTHMAQGTLTGRWAFGLQTGLGKTTCAMSWIAALHQLGMTGGVSVVVAAQDVESLCEAYDELLRLGVDQNEIGLLHRKQNARHAVTTNATQKPILLLCHARVKDKFLEQFYYQGEMRNLLIYDESLITTASSLCSTRLLQDIAGGLANRCKRDEDFREAYGELSEWMSEVDEAVANETQRMKDIDIQQSVMKFPHRSQETLDRFAALVSGKNGEPRNETIETFIQLAPTPVKLTNFQKSGTVIGFHITVPNELKNIIILDASHPIRDLVREDPSVIDAEEVLPSLKNLGCSLSSLKQYAGTTIYQMSAGGGRVSLTNAFSDDDKSNRRICKEIVDVLKSIPPDQSTLIIAFRSVYQRKGVPHFVNILESAITNAGLGAMQNQHSVATVPATGKPRISIITWGQHKGTNKYKHCSNLIMAGILHRNPLDILGVVAGHAGDIAHESTKKRLRDLQLSEVAHDAFQAIGRICCRTVVNGVAMPANIWLIHYGNGLQAKLAPVMQGAVWAKWLTKYDEIPKNQEPGKVHIAGKAIANYIHTLATESAITTRSIRRVVGESSRLKPTSFTRSIDEALRLCPNWKRSITGRSLVRINAGFGQAS